MRPLLGLLCGFLIWTSVIWHAESCQKVEQRFKFGTTDVFIRLVRSAELKYQIMKGSEILQTITLKNFSTTNNLVATDKGAYTLTDGDSTIEFALQSATSDAVHVTVTRSNLRLNSEPMDCISLDVPQSHWYGGPETHNQYYPIERLVLSNYSYLTKEDKNFGLAERYFLNSKGVFFYVEESTPLFVELNSPGYENQLCLMALNALPYNTRITSMSFTYHVGIAKNAKLAHMYAIKNLLGKPTDHPDERMVQHPIWSTWALYKTEINESVVRDFGNKIISNGFENSQLEIDDDWEDCYGALTFRKSKFPNIKQFTDELKAKGFRVTLWIHPFINKDCVDIYNSAKSNGYLVLDHDGNADTKWWNTKGDERAAYVDFTKPEVQKWFTDRLKRLQNEDGIDSFKFDAGETSWVPPDPVLQGSLNSSPNQITTEYVRTVGALGSMVEVRSGQGTQNLPIFVRMIDKDSNWKWDNGLVTLITTLIQMNLNGYPFVLPDMIGGNGYNGLPTKELFIRWLQANVFMPSLQFSYVPWIFDAETIEISKTFTKLHSQYTPYIMKRFKLAVETGEPVNPPLWWVDPDDPIAHTVYDQFLLGDDIIAAPVVTEGEVTRDIYLPKGQWQDGNTKQIHNGPIWLMDYNAPLNVLPYFERVGEATQTQ